MASVDEILEQAQWDFFWAPADAEIVDRPELLYIRSARDQAFLNTVTRTRAKAWQLPGLLDEVAEAHRGVTSRWLVCPQSQPPSLERALAERGYAAEGQSYGYALPVELFQPRPTPEIVVRRVDGRAALEDWYRVVSASFGVTVHAGEAERAAELASCQSAAARIQRFVGYDRHNAPVAAGDLRIYPALRFGYLVAGCTLPEARGRGAYSALLGARIELARARGMNLVGLYAIVDTSAKLVEHLGFRRYGPMRYWRRPAPEREDGE